MSRSSRFSKIRSATNIPTITTTVGVVSAALFAAVGTPASADIPIMITALVFAYAIYFLQRLPTCHQTALKAATGKPRA